MINCRVLRPAARISLIGPNGVRALVDQQSGGEGAVHLLGAVLAILSGATFALTNATGRRGVISGTPAQGMIISMPVGLACFLAVALLTGALQSLSRFSTSAFATLSAAGVPHFVLGRYCNFRASQAAGVNLTCARDPAQFGRHARLGCGHSPGVVHDAASHRCSPHGRRVTRYPTLLRTGRFKQIE